MPKDTFYNLADQKRKLIETAAISEFAKFGYDKASINRIVDRCDIAKGSFYQYFNDKKDLYLYLISVITDKKLKALAPVMLKKEQYDFFTLIRELFLEGLKFAAKNPEITLMGNWLFKNKEHPICNEVLGKGLQNAQDIYTGLLKKSVARGEIRDDIDLRFVSHIISSLSLSAVEYYFQNQEDKKKRIKKFDEGMINTIDLLIDFIKNGIAANKKGGSGND